MSVGTIIMLLVLVLFLQQLGVASTLPLLAVCIISELVTVMGDCNFSPPSPSSLYLDHSNIQLVVVLNNNKILTRGVLYGCIDSTPTCDLGFTIMDHC